MVKPADGPFWRSRKNGRLSFYLNIISWYFSKRESFNLPDCVEPSATPSHRRWLEGQNPIATYAGDRLSGRADVAAETAGLRKQRSFPTLWRMVNSSKAILPSSPRGCLPPAEMVQLNTMRCPHGFCANLRWRLRAHCVGNLYRKMGDRGRDVSTPFVPTRPPAPSGDTNSPPGRGQVGRATAATVSSPRSHRRVTAVSWRR